MSLTIKVISSSLLPGGQRIAVGSVLFDSSYPTGGEAMDLSSYFKADADVTVTALGGTYSITHNQGNATNGKLVVYNAVSTSGVRAQIGAATNLATLNVPFIAVGQAY